MANVTMEINDNFTDFKGNFVLGYSFKETMHLFLAVVVIGGITFILDRLGVPIEACGVIGLFPGCVIGYSGFFEKNSLTYIEYRHKKKVLDEMKSLAYKSFEDPVEILKYSELEKESEDEWRREMKGLKKLILLCILVLFVAAICIVAIRFLL